MSKIKSMWELIYSVGWDIDRYIDDDIDCGYVFILDSGVDTEVERYVTE